jgi:hypothetical protein
MVAFLVGQSISGFSINSVHRLILFLEIRAVLDFAISLTVAKFLVFSALLLACLFNSRNILQPTLPLHESAASYRSLFYHNLLDKPG